MFCAVGREECSSADEYSLSSFFFVFISHCFSLSVILRSQNQESAVPDHIEFPMTNRRAVSELTSEGVLQWIEQSIGVKVRKGSEEKRRGIGRLKQQQTTDERTGEKARGRLRGGRKRLKKEEGDVMPVKRICRRDEC